MDSDQELVDQDQADPEVLDHLVPEELEVLSFWEFPSTLEQAILSSFHLLEASLLFLEVLFHQTQEVDPQSL